MAKDSPIEAGAVPAGAVSPAPDEPERRRLRRRVDEGGFWTIPPAGPRALNPPGEPPAAPDPEPQTLEAILAVVPATEAVAEPTGAEPGTETHVATGPVVADAPGPNAEADAQAGSTSRPNPPAAEPDTRPDPPALAAASTPIESERVKQHVRREGPRMFGRQQRRDLRVVEAIREEMSVADLQVRTMLAETVAQIESRLSHDREERERAQLSADTALEHVRATVRAVRHGDGTRAPSVRTDRACVGVDGRAHRRRPVGTTGAHRSDHLVHAPAIGAVGTTSRDRRHRVLSLRSGGGRGPDQRIRQSRFVRRARPAPRRERRAPRRRRSHVRSACSAAPFHMAQMAGGSALAHRRVLTAVR